MHGMKFPINIICIDSSNRICIEHSLLPLIYADIINRPIYYPDKDALYVLKVAAGFSQRHNIAIDTM
jgi:uncharacterized membrane protein (UPF0127 family)